MSFWEILGIDPTIENSAIKKAYARKLKIYHPEDDPQGFQALREAYDKALKYAKSGEFHLEDNIVFEEFVTDLSRDAKTFSEENFDDTYKVNKYSHHNEYLIEDFTGKALSQEQLVEEFLGKVSSLYSDFFSRIEKKNWEEVLNEEIMWRLDCQQLINKKMLAFLMEHHFLPKDIWQLLNTIFHWEEEEEYLYSCYPEAFIKYLCKQIGQERVFRYCYFNKKLEIDYEKYLNYRENAFNAIFSNQLRLAKQYIFDAYKMYPYDPELLCMKAEYHLRMRQKSKTSATFRKAIRINPDDLEIHYYKAMIMFNNYKYNEVIKVCKHIQTRKPNDFEVCSILGKSYYEVRKFYNAKEVFLGNLKTNPSDIETRKYLKWIANQFEIKLEKYAFNIKLRRELKNIYEALEEPINEEIMKISFKDFLYLLKMLFYICIGIVLILGTGGAIIPIALLIRYIRHHSK